MISPTITIYHLEQGLWNRDQFLSPAFDYKLGGSVLGRLFVVPSQIPRSALECSKLSIVWRRGRDSHPARTGRYQSRLVNRFRNYLARAIQLASSFRLIKELSSSSYFTPYCIVPVGYCATATLIRCNPMPRTATPTPASWAVSDTKKEVKRGGLTCPNRRGFLS